MMTAINRELVLQKSYLFHENIETVYFGGGTPSILPTKKLEEILNTIDRHYTLTKEPEITLEANPDDLNANKLKDIKSLGINRLSIGIQSFDDNTLQTLHRAHNASQAYRCIKLAREADINNISVDLIFAIPGRSDQLLENDLQQAMSMTPEHISVYGLTIEEKTVFGNWQKKGKFNSLDEASSAKQFEQVMDTLEAGGYEQYEISNFCRDDTYSRHNTAYWQDTHYLGIGPGAHSYNGTSRQYNLPNNPKYIKSIGRDKLPCTVELLTKKNQANEYLMTGLRTKWGCDLHMLQQKYQYNLAASQAGLLSKFKDALLLTEKDEIIYLTRKGKFIADEIIANLMWV